MFYIYNEKTELFAAWTSDGEHDGKVVPDLEFARQFPTWGSASESSQNFGPDWVVVEF